MATFDQIQMQVDAINAAIASGTSRVNYGDKSVEYRSLSEMRSVRDELLRQIGQPVTTRRTVAGFNAGFR